MFKENEMKKLSKWITSLLVIAMALTMFGSTALAAQADGVQTPAENVLQIELQKSTLITDSSKFSDSDTYTFHLTQDSITYASEDTGWDSVLGFPEGSDTVSMTLTGNLGNGDLIDTDAFKGISFTKAGVFTFVISEFSTNNNNVELDLQPVIVTVDVSQRERSMESDVKIVEMTYDKGGESMDYASFINGERVPGSSLTIQKIDQDGSPLAGAEFTLRYTRGQSEGTTLTTSDDGTAVFGNLASGFYILKETPPENYTSNIPEEGIMIGIERNDNGIVSLTFYPLVGDEDTGSLTEEDLKSYGISVADDGSLVVTNTLKDVPVEPVPETPEETPTVTTASTNVKTGVTDASGTLTLIVTALAAASVAAVIAYRKRYEA